MICTQRDTKHVYKVGVKTVIHQSLISTTHVLSAHTRSRVGGWGGGGGGGRWRERQKKPVRKVLKKNKNTKGSDAYTTQIFINKNSLPTDIT